MRHPLVPHVAALAVLLALPPTAVPAAAQGARCDSVRSAPSADSVTHTVSLTASALDTLQGVPRSLVALVGQGVAQAFVAPQPLALAAYRTVPAPTGPGRVAEPVVNGDYVVVLHRDGRLGGAAVLASSLDPAFDRAVLAAIARVDSIGYRFPPPETMAGDSAFVRLRVGAVAPAGAEAWPMFRARVPRLPAGEVAAALEAPPVPYAPEAIAAGAAGAAGTVAVWFVVDSAGVPLAHTVQLLRADHPLLARMVLDAIPTLRYRPTRVGGCAVATHVSRQFDLAPPAASVAAGGKVKTPPRRLDSTRPDLRTPITQPRDSGRPEHVLSIEVWIDAEGRPEMNTLRIGGAAGTANRGEVERWVAAGAYAPARDAAGNAVRGEFRYDVRASTRVIKQP